LIETLEAEEALEEDSEEIVEVIEAEVASVAIDHSEEVIENSVIEDSSIEMKMKIDNHLEERSLSETEKIDPSEVEKIDHSEVEKIDPSEVVKIDLSGEVIDPSEEEIGEILEAVKEEVALM
jgi:hypothetical protein